MVANLQDGSQQCLPPSSYSHPHVVLSLLLQCAGGYYRNDVYDIWSWIIKSTWLLPYILLLWWKPAAMSWGHSSSTVGMCMCWGPRCFCQQPALACQAMNEPLGSGSCSLVKPSFDLSPSWHLDCTLVRDGITELSLFQTPQAQKLYEIRNAYCLKLLSFGIVCVQ